MPEMFINFPQTVRREASSAEFGREPGKWTNGHLHFPFGLQLLAPMSWCTTSGYERNAPSASQLTLQRIAASMSQHNWLHGEGAECGDLC